MRLNDRTMLVCLIDAKCITHTVFISPGQMFYLSVLKRLLGTVRLRNGTVECDGFTMIMHLWISPSV